MRRNALCSCGSGKRFKNCCGAVETITSQLAEPTTVQVPSISASESNSRNISAQLYTLDQSHKGIPGLQARVTFAAELICARRYDEAGYHLGDLLKAFPNLPIAHALFADMLWAKKQLRSALEQGERAIGADPTLALGFVVIADVYRTLRMLPEAITHYQSALKAFPNMARAYLGLGLCAFAQGRLQESFNYYQVALQQDAEYADAYYHIGDLYQSVGDYVEARKYLTKCLEYEPSNIVAACNLAFQDRVLCSWSSSRDFTLLMHQAIENPRVGAAVSPFGYLTVEEGNLAMQLRCAQQWVADRIEPVAQFYNQASLPASARRQAQRLRIGYFSADIADHATAFLMAELFELHNRLEFEVYLYSFGPEDGSVIRHRITKAVDHFIEMRDLSYWESAERVRRDGIDILVDLKGYTKMSRPQVLALRPAPIQVNYLGFPGTLGADFIDYILVDRNIVRMDEQKFFSEKFMFLDPCYQINDRKRPLPYPSPSRQACGLPDGAFVFCCFNQTYKITPLLFEVWMRILQKRPGSVLWLLHSHPVAVENLRKMAASFGVDPQRLVFAPLTSLEQHLKRFALADLFLDTFPVNAHTTASDALWVGVPVVTISGETFVSRVATSLLHAVGLPQLACGTIAEYERLALHLSLDVKNLHSLREHLASNRYNWPLFESTEFVLRLEDAYKQMWANYEQK